MLRRALHLLLALTLALNGVLAPLAMAHMGHGNHASAMGHGQHHAMPDHRSGVTQDATAHHGHHESGTALAAADTAPGDADSGPCCEGSLCQCGCVLPPVVSHAGTASPVGSVDTQRYAVPIALLLARRDAPPLRPPAA
ncbi:MAG: CopL family metal-binding regulatory protein [Xanthomonadales bacterium]|nr:CopL family metal-binding regulatory protein [Xanthomonadales bacterium]